MFSEELVAGYLCVGIVFLFLESKSMSMNDEEFKSLPILAKIGNLAIILSHLFRYVITWPCYLIEDLSLLMLNNMANNDSEDDPE
jgi:hypothetical protein